MSIPGAGWAVRIVIAGLAQLLLKTPVVLYNQPMIMTVGHG